MRLATRFCLLLTPFAAHAAAPVMTFLAPVNHTMPFAQFDDGQMTGGFLKEFGDQIARRMGYTARYLTVPGKRVALALTQGEADGVCFVVPSWIDGKFNWTRPIIPATGVVVAHTSAPVLVSIDALANQRIGTVLGYRYPELEAALGNQMLRDDAPSVHHSLAKLAVGRSRYAIVDGTTIAYLLKTSPKTPMRIDLTYLRYKASCAFSLSSPVKFADVERTLAAMVHEGAIEAMLDKYR